MVRLTDRPDMTLDVYRGRKTTMQQQQQQYNLVSSNFCKKHRMNKASQAIQSPRTVPFFLLVSSLDGYSFPNVLVKGIVAFKHKKKLRP